MGVKLQIGKIVQARREELGLSRKEVASLLRINADYYKKIELGLREPSINIKAEIAAILKISLSDLP